MLAAFESALADNGLYFFSAYAIVLMGLAGYAFWLRARLAALEQRSGPAEGHDR